MADEVARSSGEYRLPAALVEKMAEALHGMMCASPTPYEQCRLTNGNYFLGAAKTAAAALLDGCEVREEWGARHDCGDYAVWSINIPSDWPGWEKLRRVVITTPDEPVDPPFVAPFVRLEGPPGEEPG